MKSAPPSLVLNGSKLVQVLTSLAIADVSISHKRFIAKLSQLIDLGDSVNLADVLKLRIKPSDSALAPALGSAETQFLQSRASMLAAIHQQVQQRANKLIATYYAEEQDQPWLLSAFAALYSSQQRVMDASVYKLKEAVRQTLSPCLGKLQKLLQLDAILTEISQPLVRENFAKVPVLLEHRLQGLLDKHKADEPLDAVLQQFITELEQVLIAELDIRLNPVLGMIEAAQESAQE